MQHPDDLRLTSYQIAEWMGYDRLEPISLGMRMDASAALVASVIANVNRDPKQRSEPWTPADFLIRWDPDEHEMEKKKDPTPEELLAKAEIYSALGFGVMQDEDE